MTIHSYENSIRADACIEYLREIDGVKGWERIILLPIPTTRDNRTILNTKVDIYELLSTFDSETFVSGYGLPSDFIDAACRLGATVVDLSLCENFLLENAELTALATLGIILGSTRVAPRQIRVGIVGYGRIGKKMTNLLLYLGAPVKVFTTRRDTRLDLSEYGVVSSATSSDADLSGLDLLINTAPAAIFPKSSVPDGLRIIDLASGENFPGVDGVERYPSVPAKMFPVSAGRVWARTLEPYLVNNL